MFKTHKADNGTQMAAAIPPTASVRKTIIPLIRLGATTTREDFITTCNQAKTNSGPNTMILVLKVAETQDITSTAMLAPAGFGK